MLRRSDRMAVTTALPFVLANFGIAMAARIPMITTTISSSISVKPLDLLMARLRAFPVSTAARRVENWSAKRAATMRAPPSLLTLTALGLPAGRRALGDHDSIGLVGMRTDVHDAGVRHAGVGKRQ